MLRRLLAVLLLLSACAEAPDRVAGDEAPHDTTCHTDADCSAGSTCSEGQCAPIETPSEPGVWQAPRGPAGLGVLSSLLVTGDRMYFAGYGTLAVSRDDGATLQEAETFPPGRVEELVEAGGVVFARNIDGLLAVTRDGGTSWHAPAVQLLVFTIHGDADTLFVTGMDAAGTQSFHRSTNRGLAWQAIPDVLPQHLAVGAGWVVAQDRTGALLRSEDAGVTWTELPEPPFVEAGFDVLLQAWDGALVALTDRPLRAHVSLDRGNTWSTQLLDEDSISSQRWLVGSSDGLFAVTNGGLVYRLPARDGTWHAAGEGLEQGAFVEAVTGGPRGAWLVWRGTLSHYDAQAEAWRPHETPVVRTAVGDVAVDGDTVWAVADGKVVHRSDDGGRTWSQAASPGADVLAIRAIAAGDGKVWIGTWSHGVLRSDDRGATWVPLAGVPSMVGEPGVQPWGAEDLLYENGTLWAGTWAMVHLGGDDGNFGYAGVGPIRSHDGGDTWELGTAGLPAIAPDGRGGQLRDGTNRILSAGGVLFASTYGHGVFRSADGGVSWQEASRGMPDGELDATAEMFDVVEVGGVFYAAVGVSADKGSGLIESHDGGLTWRGTTAAPPGPCSARALVRVGDRLVVSWDRFGQPDQNEGIWASADGARTWERLGDGVPGSPADNLAIAGNALLAGTDTNGVWRLPLAE